MALKVNRDFTLEGRVEPWRKERVLKVSRTGIVVLTSFFEDCLFDKI